MSDEREPTRGQRHAAARRRTLKSWPATSDPVMEYLAAAAEAVGEIRRCHTRLVQEALAASATRAVEQSMRSHLVNERAKLLYERATLGTALVADNPEDAERAWVAIGHTERTHWRTLAREALIDEGILTKEGN